MAISGASAQLDVAQNLLRAHLDWNMEDEMIGAMAKITQEADIIFDMLNNVDS